MKNLFFTALRMLAYLTLLIKRMYARQHLVVRKHHSRQRRLAFLLGLVLFCTGLAYGASYPEPSFD